MPCPVQWTLLTTLHGVRAYGAYSLMPAPRELYWAVIPLASFPLPCKGEQPNKKQLALEIEYTPSV